MRVLVTGGAGFIGSFVCERLLALGHTVRVLDNLDPQVHPVGERPRVPPGVEFRQDDLRDRSACHRALEGIDVVVHAAAAVGVAHSMYQVRHYIDVNVTGTATLLEALIARRLDPRLPAMKALGVPELGRHLAGQTTLEDAALAAKQATRNFAKRQLTWLRNQVAADCVFEDVYGPEGRDKAFSFISEFLTARG